MYFLLDLQAPSTSYPTYLPRYSSMIRITIEGVTWEDMKNQTVLSRSVKMAIAVMFDTTVDDIGDLRVIGDDYDDYIRSSSPTFSPTSAYYVSGTYDDIEDYKYDDGEVLDYAYVRRCRGECCTVEVDVKSIYELDIFTDLMMNRSDAFIDNFKLFAYNYNFTYGNYTGLWTNSITNASKLNRGVNISSCSLIQASSNTVAPTVAPTSQPTSHPTTPAPTCRLDTFQFIDVDYLRSEKVNDGNMSAYNVTTREQYLHFFLLGDWGKGGNSGDITGEATYEPSASPTSSPTSETSPSTYQYKELTMQRHRRNRRLKGHRGDGGYESADEGEERGGEEGRGGQERGGEEGRDGQERGGDEGREGEGDHDHNHEDEHEDEHEDHEHDHERDHRTGREEKTYQAAIAKQMSRLANKMSVKFVVALGDNFYDDGVQSTSGELIYDMMIICVYIDI